MANILSLNIENPTLAPLATRSYSKQYTNVPNRAIKGEFAASLQAFYRALCGEPLAADDHTVTVRAQNGTLSKLYGPTLYGVSDSMIVIKWGQKMLHLAVDSKQKALQFISEEGTPIGLGTEFVTAAFADVKIGNSRDLVLRLSVFDESTEETQILDIGTWTTVNDEDGLPTADELNQFVRRAPKKAFKFLKECPSFESFEGDTFNLADLQPGEYKVIGYRRLKMDRVQFMLRVSANPELGREADFECWGHNCINPALLSDPVVSAEQPATLMLHAIKENKKGKLRPVAGIVIDAAATKDTDIDLDF